MPAGGDVGVTAYCELGLSLEALGIAVVPPERRSAAHLGKFVANEIARWAEVIKTSGVTAD